MNEQHLAAIEKRWSEASSGPWCVDDMTKPRGQRGIVLTSKEAMARFLNGESPLPNNRLESVCVNTFEMMQKTSNPPTKEEWLESLELRLRNGPGVEEVITSMRTIVCMPRARMEEQRRKVDRKALSGHGGASPPEPVSSFAILGPEQEGLAKDADVTFVIHASEDVGDLISEVRRQGDRIASLEAIVATMTKERDEARRGRESANAAVAAMKMAAKKVLDMEVNA